MTKTQESKKTKAVKNRSRYRFKQIEDIGLIALQCPCCSYVFGVESKVVDLFSEIHYEYTCPYCKAVGFLNE